MAATTKTAPRVKKFVSVRDGPLLENWYYETFRSNKLLTAEAERELAQRSVAGDRLDTLREDLEARLGRRLTLAEWSRHAGLDDVAELRQRLLDASRARDVLVESNMRLVVSIARPYIGRGNNALAMEDLVQEGTVGLMTAVRRFDPTRGLRFSTFATWWIRSAVGRAYSSQSRLIRLPSEKLRMLSKMKKAHGAFVEDYGREPTEIEPSGCMAIEPPYPRMSTPAPRSR